MDTKTEVWKPVVGWEGLYEVSNYGNVRSVDRFVRYWRGQRLHKGKIISPARERNGATYRLTLLLCANGKSRHARVHTLVAAAFIGPKPDNTEVCHNDGNAENNHAENLRYGTRLENTKDSYAHGTRVRGEKHPMAKLSRAKALAIRKAVTNGATQTSQAAKYGVSDTAVSCVVRNHTWA